MIIGFKLATARGYIEKHELKLAEAHTCCTLLHRLEELRGEELLIIGTPGWHSDWCRRDLVEELEKRGLKVNENSDHR